MTLLRRTYYHLKPYLPLHLRMVARRSLATHLLSRSESIWPIKPGTHIPPANWPGWPNGKKFAVVLTHDVESRRGLEHTSQLAALEESFGFRSSFNFIPEGDYTVPEALRTDLVRRGFEIGVHDLHHDGKLYSSRAEFEHHAQRINSYLREWKTKGFRSGFMHHNLDWLHQLDIAYDMSTFDTDPFEPQPDGAETIFPFWVQSPRPPSSVLRPPPSAPLQPLALSPQPFPDGYLELPYTLAQDSTLFFLLEEQGPRLWKTKLDWIARHGGMALLNVHPDYINFANNRTSRDYPVSYYSEFLDYLRQNYKNDAWFALPHEVAAHCTPARPEKPELSRKRVCMISYSFYESDNRVMRYAEALAHRGDSVDVIALSTGDKPAREVIEGVSLRRIQRRERNEKGKFNYLFRILRFLASSSALLTWRNLCKRYDVIHVHNVPDFLVFAAWFPKLTGARVILDIHDLLPEFFASKFKAAKNADWYVERLHDIEHASCHFAHHVIISNHLWYDTITARSVLASNCSTIVNHVDSEIFYPRPRTRNDGKIIAIFPGGLQAHQGLDTAIRAFPKVLQHFPTAEFHIYGEGNMKAEWLALAASLGLEKHILFFRPLPLHEIADKIANADIGLVPKRADTFGNEAYSTKIMEFMSQGLPVVASRTKIDTYYFNDNQLAFFESGNPDDMAEKIIHVLQNRPYADELIANGLAYVAQNNWDTKKHEYFAIVDRLDATTSAPTATQQRRTPTELAAA